MDVSTYRLSDSIRIGRPAAEVYAIVSDVTRMGELSPVCTSCIWDDVSQAGREGAWFTGRNVIGDFTWDTRCHVDSAVPGKNFAFLNCGPGGEAALVRWAYALEEKDGETMVTESWQVLPAYPDYVTADNPTADVAACIDGFVALTQAGLRDTLANLKRVAEA